MKLSSIKKAIGAILIASAVLPAAAVDFGGLLNDNTKFSGNQSLSLDQKNALSAWMRVPFNNAGTCYFATEGVVQYEYIQFTGQKLFTADCDLLKFGGIFNIGKSNKLILSAGRFYISDASGIIFAQNSDGIHLQFNMPMFTIKAYGGYTGLLNAQTVTMLNSATSTYSYDSTKPYALAAPYAIAGASFNAPYLFANQSLGVQFYGFFGTLDSTAGYNRMYGTLSLNGPLASKVFYTITSTIGTNDSFSTFGNLSQLQVNWYPAFKSMSVTLSGLYASGKNGPLSPFIGFTSNPSTTAFDSPEYSSIIKMGLSASIKPINALYVALGADCILGCPDTVSFKGFQWNASSRYQLFSDVQLGFSATQYFGSDSTTNKTALTAKAVISF